MVLPLHIVGVPLVATFIRLGLYTVAVPSLMHNISQVTDVLAPDITTLESQWHLSFNTSQTKL